MSWKDAKAEATKRIARLELPDGRLDGWRITLHTYDSQELFEFDGHVGSLTFHQMVKNAVFRELRRRGAIVETLVITRDQRLQMEGESTTLDI
jgi:hypothetical protein